MEARAAGGTVPRPWPVRLAGLAREHRAFALVLCAGALVRLAVAVAYRPALFYSDSWTYLDVAYRELPVGIAPDRPSGYPLILRVAGAVGDGLAAVTTLQHLAGLATGTLAYALLLRLAVPRSWAVAGAAVVLLDAYAIVLEQEILPEAFFTLALVLGAFLTVGDGRGPAALAAGGLLIGASATLRTIGALAIPVWLVYLLWAHGASTRKMRAAVAAAAAVAPVVLYCAAHAASLGTFAMSDAQGWFLYGRVGEISECRDADVPADGRFLCERTADDRLAAERGDGALYWIWSERSPARRRYTMGDADADDVLGRFARAIIRDRPGEYAELVAADFLRFFRPGEASRGTSDLALTLPEEPRRRHPFLHEGIRTERAPGYEPAVRAPAAVLRAYADVVHTPRWLLAILALAGVAAVTIGVTTRRSTARHRETFLLVAAPLAMLLGAAATSEFVLRYLIPMVTLLVCGGLAALADLRGVRR